MSTNYTSLVDNYRKFSLDNHKQLYPPTIFPCSVVAEEIDSYSRRQTVHCEILP